VQTSEPAERAIGLKPIGRGLAPVPIFRMFFFIFKIILYIEFEIQEPRTTREEASAEETVVSCSRNLHILLGLYGVFEPR
jgi:hypothetical protein